MSRSNERKEEVGVLENGVVTVGWSDVSAKPL